MLLHRFRHYYHPAMPKIFIMNKKELKEENKK
jgi:hypothetical protein